MDYKFNDIIRLDRAFNLNYYPVIWYKQFHPAIYNEIINIIKQENILEQSWQVDKILSSYLPELFLFSKYNHIDWSKIVLKNFDTFYEKIELNNFRDKRLLKVFGEYKVDQIVKSLAYKGTHREEGELFRILSCSDKNILYYRERTNSCRPDEWQSATLEEAIEYWNKNNMWTEFENSSINENSKQTRRSETLKSKLLKML